VDQMKRRHARGDQGEGREEENTATMEAREQWRGLFSPDWPYVAVVALEVKGGEERVVKRERETRRGRGKFMCLRSISPPFGRERRSRVDLEFCLCNLEESSREAKSLDLLE